MQKELETIIYKLHELLAVEQLEYHNKTWLSGSEATRSEQKQDNLKYLINQLNTLALDVAGNRPMDKMPSEESIGCGMQALKMRQG